VTLADQDMKAAIAATRFGLGARPGEIAEARRDPQGFLRAQIRQEGADLLAGVASSSERLGDFREHQLEQRNARLQKAAMAAGEEGKDARLGEPDARDPVKIVGRMLRQDVGSDFGARVQLAVTTGAGFREQLGELLGQPLHRLSHQGDHRHGHRALRERGDPTPRVWPLR
jgi:uncharacterized protein (DUF1800 family)